MHDLEHDKLSPCPRDLVQFGQCGMAKKFVSVCYGNLGYPSLATDHTVLLHIYCTCIAFVCIYVAVRTSYPFNFRIKHFASFAQNSFIGTNVSILCYPSEKDI